MASTDTILVPTNGSGGTEILLSDEDAEMLRAYKVFLKSYRLREALYCDSCWDGTKEDGCKAKWISVVRYPIGNPSPSRSGLRHLLPFPETGQIDTHCLEGRARLRSDIG